MIRAIWSDRPTFKKVENLRPGLNVILADRTRESSNKDSRNGLGKTKLVEIIDFCLGSRPRKGQGLMVKPLSGWTFYLNMTIAGKDVIVSRNTENPQKVSVSGDWSSWPIKPKINGLFEEATMTVSEWTTLLGILMFGLDLRGLEKKYLPSFRSLISYFVRTGIDAFSNPFQHHRNQKEWDIQVNNAFLLGLSWDDASDWQLLKDREQLLTQLKSAAEAGLIKDVLGSLGELEATRVRLENLVRQEEEQLRTFRVHPQYEEIQIEVDALTEEIHLLINENASDRNLLEFYESSLQEEQGPNDDTLVRIYKEIGIELPSLVRKQLEDVREFHKRIITNRRDFLRGEIDKLRQKMDERKKVIMQKTEERAIKMEILKTHGALDEYNRLQQRHLEIVANLKKVDNQIESLKKFEEGKSALRIEREILQRRAISDYDERKIQRERAITLFNANSEALYSAPGNLLINVTRNGFKFDVEIERSKSQGFERMKVFCYDLMLAQLWSQRRNSPNFLVHDSTIFDGVDERQVAAALVLAAKESERFGFQYICMLNSDMVPWDEFPSNFNFDNYIRLRLTDASEDGGILGIRF
ncbi:MAG: DUF2326 domain-containing protein [Thermoanaerobacteraceae bacterium]|nr:DUF2326 domain-containing protein [Thermoanaerobacteraceae bacterium]